MITEFRSTQYVRNQFGIGAFHIYTWLTDFAEGEVTAIALTLKSRDLSLTLPERSMDLTLKSRSLDLTLPERD